MKNPYNREEGIKIVSIDERPKEGDKYIYKEGKVLPSGIIAYYLKDNVFYLYGIGDNNRIIRERTPNKIFNRYKLFYRTNEGTEYVELEENDEN